MLTISRHQHRNDFYPCPSILRIRHSPIKTKAIITTRDHKYLATDRRTSCFKFCMTHWLNPQETAAFSHNLRFLWEFGPTIASCLTIFQYLSLGKSCPFLTVYPHPLQDHQHHQPMQLPITKRNMSRLKPNSQTFRILARSWKPN